jgi:hypothetical protein
LELEMIVNIFSKNSQTTRWRFLGA